MQERVLAAGGLLLRGDAFEAGCNPSGNAGAPCYKHRHDCMYAHQGRRSATRIQTEYHDQRMRRTNYNPQGTWHCTLERVRRTNCNPQGTWHCTLERVRRTNLNPQDKTICTPQTVRRTNLNPQGIYIQTCRARKAS